MVTYSYSLIDFEYFLMIMVRIASFLFTAPLFGMSGVPNRVKIGLALFLSILLYQILPQETLSYVDIFGFSVIVIKEAVTGLLLGFAANICTYIVSLAGTFIDQNIGLSMAAEFDPITQQQAAITGNLYNNFVMLLLLVSGLDHYLIQALAESYELIPVNGQAFQYDSMLNAMVVFMAELFSIAFRITLPVFACIMVTNALLGIMAKVAPQMNMFSVGMQIKIIIGFVILLATVQLLPYIESYIFTEMKKMVVAFVESMYAG